MFAVTYIGALHRGQQPLEYHEEPSKSKPPLQYRQLSRTEPVTLAIQNDLRSACYKTLHVTESSNGMYSALKAVLRSVESRDVWLNAIISVL